VRRAAGKPDKDSEVRSVVMIGANAVGIKFAGICDRIPNLFMHMHGFFDDRTDDRHPPNLRHPMLGKMSDIAAYVRAQNIKMIFISQPISAQPRIRKLLDELQDTTASVYFLPDIYIFDLMQARFDNVGGMPVIAILETPFMGLNSMIKRSSDIVLGSVILLMLVPVMIAIAVAVQAPPRRGR
jgi:putative colanic acid biosynthesis UDP-glucose lipid carrier transferase